MSSNSDNAQPSRYQARSAANRVALLFFYSIGAYFESLHHKIH